jgi:hypothetical protein
MQTKSHNMKFWQEVHQNASGEMQIAAWELL